ncbi:MAG: hypothetical protein LBF16_07370 [Pseudomonadales bacterium]|jgi:hypothetical protein|nr:hypothetical protein [Pseudomonadales bacterium]
MSVLFALLFIVFCGAAMLLVPLVTVGAALAVAAGAFLIWLLPILLIASSNKTTGGEKLCWILAIVCLSWFAWILYFLVAPIKPRQAPFYYY